MDDAIEVEAARGGDAEVTEAIARLLPELSSTAIIPSAGQLEEIVASPSTTLLLARDRSQGGRIVGALTIAVFRVPSGVRAWIEDVVVESAARGKGVGEGLTRAALELAASRGARTVDLTSRPSRASANRLYRRLGFQLRETNVFRYVL